MNRGKFVILSILIVGLSMSSFAWWNRMARSRQVLAHFGPDVPVHIRKGKQVELLRLAEVGTSAGQEILPLGDGERVVVDTIDISQERGLIHARHQMVQSEAYAWDTPAQDGCVPQWPVALRFHHENATSTIAVDFLCRRARLVERDVEVGMGPLAEGLQVFVRGLLPEAAGTDEPTGRAAALPSDANP